MSVNLLPHAQYKYMGREELLDEKNHSFNILLYCLFWINHGKVNVI
jgi:hypothetical protein